MSIFKKSDIFSHNDLNTNKPAQINGRHAYKQINRIRSPHFHPEITFDVLINTR